MIKTKTELKIAELQRVLELQLPFRLRWNKVSVTIDGQNFIIKYFDNSKMRTTWEFHEIEKPLYKLNAVLYYEKASLNEKFKARLTNPTYLENIHESKVPA